MSANFNGNVLEYPPKPYDFKTLHLWKVFIILFNIWTPGGRIQETFLIHFLLYRNLQSHFCEHFLVYNLFLFIGWLPTKENLFQLFVFIGEKYLIDDDFFLFLFLITLSLTLISFLIVFLSVVQLILKETDRIIMN